MSNIKEGDTVALLVDETQTGRVVHVLGNSLAIERRGLSNTEWFVHEVKKVDDGGEPTSRPIRPTFV